MKWLQKLLCSGGSSQENRQSRRSSSPFCSICSKNRRKGTASRQQFPALFSCGMLSVCFTPQIRGSERERCLAVFPPVHFPPPVSCKAGRGCLTLMHGVGRADVCLRGDLNNRPTTKNVEDDNKNLVLLAL